MDINPFKIKRRIIQKDLKSIECENNPSGTNFVNKRLIKNNENSNVFKFLKGHTKILLRTEKSVPHLCIR